MIYTDSPNAIEVIFVARVLVAAPPDNPVFNHRDAIDFLEHSLQRGMEASHEHVSGERVLGSVCYMAGEFRDALKEENVARDIGL